MSYAEIETSGEIGEKDLEKSNTVSEKSRENASMGLQPQCCSIRGGNGATQWTQSPKALSARHKVWPQRKG